MKTRLIIADDHAILRQGLRDLIEGTDDLEVVGEAADGLEAERLARSRPADLLVLDIALPGRRGLEVLGSLRADGVALPVLLFSMYPPEQYTDYASRAGAQGFVSKSASGDEVLRAIRCVAAGGTHFPPVGRSAHGHVDAGNPFAVLSRREAEVMQGLLEGASLLTIAARIGVGAKSVTTYRRRLLDKLGVHSNAELAALASRHGYV
jgi:DNA-binding NarL/FixJ family response regulator